MLALLFKRESVDIDVGDFAIIKDILHVCEPITDFLLNLSGEDTSTATSGPLVQLHRYSVAKGGIVDGPDAGSAAAAGRTAELGAHGRLKSIPST
jgi:hypothetical protein